MNGCAPGLALIERLRATRKWAIIDGLQQYIKLSKEKTFYRRVANAAFELNLLYAIVCVG